MVNRRMVDRLRQRLIDVLPQEYRERLVNWCLQLSTYQARRRLTTTGAIKVLVDNSVLGNANTHETVEIAQKINWPPGGQPGEVPVSYRTPREYDDGMYEHICYLPGIAHLARAGLLELKTSCELLNEREHQPIGRFLGKRTVFSYDIFDGIKLESVDGYIPFAVDPSYFCENSTINKVINSTDIDPLGLHPNNKEKQIERIAQSTDSLYTELAKILPKKSNLDAWHIRTAERYGLFCFLTVDFKLQRDVDQNKNKEPIASLRTKVMTPMAFGKYVGVSPVNPYICELAENDAAKSSARLRKQLR